MDLNGKKIQIELLHLPSDPIDVCVGHLEWSGDFNLPTVESDHSRSMLSDVMEGLF